MGTSLSQIHDSTGINQIPSLWGNLPYTLLSITPSILAFQLPSREHVCHLGLGDNSKVWLQTIQSLVLSPSLSPCSSAIHQVLKEGCSPSSLTKKGGETIIWGIRLWAGFELLKDQRYKSQRLSSESLGFPIQIQAAGDWRSRRPRLNGCTHSHRAAQKRLCAKEMLIWITLKVKEKDCFIS